MIVVMDKKYYKGDKDYVTLEAVSYTHLDVYKRQTLSRSNKLAAKVLKRRYQMCIRDSSKAC